MPGRTGLDGFIAQCAAIVSRQRDPAAIVREVSEKMRRLLEQGGALAEACRGPDPDRRMFHDDPDLVVFSKLWEPGEGTPVHDHGTWGVVGVLEGELKVTRFRRLDDGKTPGYADLREAGGGLRTPGSVLTLVPPHEDIHQVKNRHDGGSWTLHAYGRDISDCNTFDPRNKRVT